MPLLEVRGLSFSFPDGRRALNGVTLTLYEGEKLALAGSNGSGKSTLLLHLAGCLTAQEGEVLLRGNPTADDLEGLRRSVGLSFQEPDDQFFMPQVLEDVAFGLVARGIPPAEAQRRALETLSSLGVAHLVPRFPHRLSGGEKRMAALAGILAMRPDVLLLDEPTAALDPRARRRVIEVLKGLETPLILATHDLDMALDVCPRTVLLHDGTAAAEGATAELLQDESLLLAHGLELPLSCGGTRDRRR